MGASGLRESTGSARSFSLVRFRLLGLSSWNMGSAWAVEAGGGEEKVSDAESWEYDDSLVIPHTLLTYVLTCYYLDAIRHSH